MGGQPTTAINTYTGRILDFADPDPDEIELIDIAHGLAIVPRFGAQAKHFYPVAQHAVHVSQIVEAITGRDLAFAALHHDSHEAYACDIPAPLKHLLEPNYSEVTERVDQAIATALEIELPSKDTAAGKAIKAADQAAFVVEAQALLAGGPNAPDVNSLFLDAARATIDLSTGCWTSERAREEFQRRHNELAAPAVAGTQPSQA